MKKSIIRRVAALLCVVLFAAMFPVQALAHSDAYTTVAYTKEKDKKTGKTVEGYHQLKFPSKSALYTEKGKLPMRAKVKASWKNGCIYFMPQPALGHGVLGTVDTGTPVTILAVQNNLYFFMTDDGRMGWNGGTFFTKPKAIDKDLSQPLSDDSPLTGEDVVAVSDYIAGHRYGCSPNTLFYAERPVVVLESGESAKVRVHGLYCNAKYSFKRTSGESAEAEWTGKKFSNGRRTVEFTANEPGVSVFKFTNNRNKVAARVLVIVV